MDNVISLEKRRKEKEDNEVPHLVMNQKSIGVNRVTVVPLSVVEDYVSGKLKKEDIEDFDGVMRVICLDFINFLCK